MQNNNATAVPTLDVETPAEAASRANRKAALNESSRQADREAAQEAARRNAAQQDDEVLDAILVDYRGWGVVTALFILSAMAIAAAWYAHSTLLGVFLLALVGFGCADVWQSMQGWGSILARLAMAARIVFCLAAGGMVTGVALWYTAALPYVLGVVFFTLLYRTFCGKRGVLEVARRFDTDRLHRYED